MGDKKNNRNEKMLIKEFRGMKERFSDATHIQKFKSVAEIFITDFHFFKRFWISPKKYFHISLSVTRM